MAETTRRHGRSILGIPVSALAALPVCPACYPAYAGILSALGTEALTRELIEGSDSAESLLARLSS